MEFPEKYEPQWSRFLDTFSPLHPDIIEKARQIHVSGKRAALIIEPRNHPLLQKVFHNFYSKLVLQDFIFIIAHGTENRNMAQSITEHLPHCEVWDLGIRNFTSSEYSAFCASFYFWDTLHEKNIEKILLFQTDTLLFKDNINDFMDYDYVGAPWKSPTVYGSSRKMIPFGNGGLSIRSVKSHREIIAAHPYPEGCNEDVYFSFYHHADKTKYNLPTIRKAMEFSCETLVSKDPLGTHNPYPLVFSYLCKHILK